MHQHNLIEEIQRLGITHITADSRKTGQGSAFFAMNTSFINEAVQKGAQLVITTENNYELPQNVSIIKVPDVHAAFAQAAQYLHPEVPDYLVAVTGTSGKTSIVNYFMQICELLGHKAASIGSLGVKCTDKKLEQELTREDDLNTPDIITMRKILSSLKKGGINFVAFEASSHGIDQQRIHGIEVDAACFTNLSHDHLDYHRTMEAYLQVKLRLFKENLKLKGKIVTSSELQKYFKDYADNVVIVGKDGNIKIISSKQSAQGQKIEFTYLDKLYVFSSSICGSFQAINLLMAASLIDKTIGDFDQIVSVLPKVIGVRGRLERVTSQDHNYQVFVDYSHKPGALKSALIELKSITRGKLIVVFGCGGDRDKEKRPIMGQIASKLADLVIITDDNPRSENANLIRSEIIACAPSALEIEDREMAIKTAMERACDGDIVLIAGKGHETYQIIGNKKLPFDDYDIAKKYIGTK